MSPSVSLTTFGVIFLAELGDKTQLTAMALAARHPWKKVLAGIAVAFLVLNAGAVLIGKALFAFVPLTWVKVASAALFLYFGITTVRNAEADEDDDVEQARDRPGNGPFLTAFSMILLAELGDKTQILTASLAAQHAAQWSVFIGSTLALWTVSALGVMVGSQLSRWLPLARVKRAAGILFLLFALGMMVELIRPLL